MRSWKCRITAASLPGIEMAILARRLLASRACLSLSLRRVSFGASISFVFELPELLAHLDKGAGLVWLNMVCRFEARPADLASTLGGRRGRAACVRPE
jgi:hypothetical protein